MLFPKGRMQLFLWAAIKNIEKTLRGCFFTLLLIDNGDLLLNLKCFKLYLRKLHVIMPCSKGGGLCKMIFKSKYGQMGCLGIRRE